MVTGTQQIKTGVNQWRSQTWSFAWLSVGDNASRSRTRCFSHITTKPVSHWHSVQCQL